MSSAFKRIAEKQMKSKLQLSVSCPECGAAEGKACKNLKGGKRFTNHQARVDSYRRAE